MTKKTAKKKSRHDKACSVCAEPGHNMRTCTSAKAASARQALKRSKK